MMASKKQKKRLNDIYKKTKTNKIRIGVSVYKNNNVSNIFFQNDIYKYSILHKRQCKLDGLYCESESFSMK